MRAEALELYCRSLSYFFASKKLKKRRASTMRIACRGSRIVLSIFIILFREQKAQKKKSLNYAYCVSRLSTGAGVLTELNKKHSKINGLSQPTN